ncbi:hypothetical protein SUGI_0489560 [Cryptomeria japonica]|uniref:metallothionein-like protein type 2 n=1 Tax=Cryptomeria japonica TaxID=3369 RepID=UPI002408D3CD|nr:metallothionein-like protein type 2 [Cryptomeria japonica]GLJ25563.1 hypothetical protein SUGI_0489560 [Cryptomeria japonica]
MLVEVIHDEILTGLCIITDFSSINSHYLLHNPPIAFHLLNSSSITIPILLETINMSSRSTCTCGKRCGMYPDLTGAEKSVAQSIVLGLTASDMGHVDEGVTVAGENGCKCGSNCTCDPCNCK